MAGHTLAPSLCPCVAANAADLHQGTWYQRCYDPECHAYRSACMPLPADVWEDACARHHQRWSPQPPPTQGPVAREAALEPPAMDTEVVGVAAPAGGTDARRLASARTDGCETCHRCEDDDLEAAYNALDVYEAELSAARQQRASWPRALAPAMAGRLPAGIGWGATSG